MSIQKDIKDMVDAEVISQETADRIRAYYQSKEGNAQHRLFAIFGVLGAVLVGLGIILIIAHNWDNLSKGLKTFFAFLPLILGQIAAAYTLWKQERSVAWREGSAAFIFFALGACISLLSQIYNIPGNLGSFILTWMLLALPMIYILGSSLVGVFYLLGITYYGCEVGYFNWRSYEGFNWYWLLIVGVLPHYYILFKQKANSNFFSFFNWLIPMSLMICLGTLSDKNEEWVLLSYLSLFAVFYLIAKSSLLARTHVASNGFRVLGTLGTLFILLMTSFRSIWDEFKQDNFEVDNSAFLAFLVLTLLALVLIFLHVRQSSWKTIFPLAYVFILFIPLFFLGMESNLVFVLINILLLTIGILTINKGVKEAHLGVLNFGLLIIVALVSSRFFDTDLSFVLRGLLFVSLGLGFFLVNYYMIKKLKRNEK